MRVILFIGQTTGKLHVLGESKKWAERGVGHLKINFQHDDPSKRRISKFASCCPYHQ